MGRPVKVTGKRVIDAFSEYYLEATGENFHPNYGMIVMAEKLSDYWTLPEVMEAMNQYFQGAGKKSYYDFMNKIDEYFRAAKDKLEMTEWFSDLEKQTSETVRQIQHQRRGEAD